MGAPDLCPDAGAAYTVVPGDTLGAIAARLGVSLDALVAVNGITDPNRLSVGQVLIIPGALGALPLAAGAGIPTGAVFAAPGETVASLATRYGQEGQLIADLNGFSLAARLFPGQPVQIPSAAIPAEPLRFGTVLSVTVSPAIVQGRTGRLYVTTSRPVSLAATWLDQPVVFTPITDDGLRQAALLPVGPIQEPGSYNLVLGYTTNRGIPVSLSRSLQVEAGSYTYQEIIVAEDKANVMTPEAVRGELDKVIGLWSQVSAEAYWKAPFVRPIDPQYSTTSAFGTRRTYSVADIGSFHAGQDFGAPEGVLVTAPAPGIVVLAESLIVRGNAVILDHGRGVFTGYWHLSEIKVVPGQVVNTGDVLGLTGNTGLSTGAHLHWELRVNGVAVDPMQFLDEAPFK